MKQDSLKRRLRALKKQEKALRGVPEERLLFGKYFTKRFGLAFLQALDENAFSTAVDEYWADVIFTYFKENGLSAGVRNPELLGRSGAQV